MKWQIKTKAPSAFFKQFPDLSPLIAQLIYNRGLKTQKQVDEFFNPDYQEDIHDPFLLKDMDKAVERIKKAIKKKEKITIYGDFDADGVCSSAIIYLTLKELGVKDIDVYIPDRVKENHGLNEKSVEKLARTGTKLIITVDCASTDLREADLIKSLGMDLIITDHHRPGKKDPQAVAFVNPWRRGDKYPFKELSGAGVAYKLACAFLPIKKKSFKKWLLDLVAIATVADVMPIVGENRTLVRYGLGVLAQTKSIGLQELMKISKVDPEVSQISINGEAPLTNLDTYTLGFILGPRLNAASRMDHANTTFKLLVTENKKEAQELAQQLNQNNLDRQNLTEKIARELNKRLEKKISQGENTKLIFEGSPDWPIGLIGLIAGKIKDKYCQPAIIYHQQGELIHASCRSIPQLDLMEILNQTSDLFEDFGGHKGAAGFQIKKKNLEKTKKLLTQLVEKKLKDQELNPCLDIDFELSLADINWHNYDQIELFAPFGKANSKPIFLIRKVEISDLRVVGNNGKHLKMELLLFDKDSNKAKNFNAIAFGFGDKEPILKKGQLVDVIFEMIVNQWNGHRGLEIKIVDLRLCK